jgi:hypothetical protein
VAGSPHRSPDGSPVVFLIDAGREGEAHGHAPGAVCIAEVRDLPRLLSERGAKLHGDAVDALVDLVVSLMEDADGQGSDSR